MKNVFVTVHNSKFELNLKLCDNKNYCYLLLGLITGFTPLLILCKENKIRSYDKLCLSRSPTDSTENIHAKENLDCQSLAIWRDVDHA